MTRARPIEPWNSKPIADTERGFIIERFSRWLELLRRSANIAISGAINSEIIILSGPILRSTDIVYVSGSTTLTLPPGVDYLHPVTIKNVGILNVTIESDGSELVESAVNASLAAKDSYTMGYDGTDWWVI